MLKTLYARFLLWLIRPALHRYMHEIAEQRREEILDIVFKDIASNPRSGIRCGLESVYGLRTTYR